MFVFTNQRLAGREILVPKSVMDESVVSGLTEDSMNTDRNRYLDGTGLVVWLAVGVAWLSGCMCLVDFE